MTQLPIPIHVGSEPPATWECRGPHEDREVASVRFRHGRGERHDRFRLEPAGRWRVVGRFNCSGSSAAPTRLDPGSRAMPRDRGLAPCPCRGRVAAARLPGTKQTWRPGYASSGPVC